MKNQKTKHWIVFNKEFTESWGFTQPDSLSDEEAELNILSQFYGIDDLLE